MAEARALRDGLYAAVKAGIKHIIIEGDNATVIQAIKGTISTPWRIQTLVHDISTILKTMNQITISHIFCEANMEAD